VFQMMFGSIAWLNSSNLRDVGGIFIACGMLVMVSAIIVYIQSDESNKPFAQMCAVTAGSILAAGTGFLIGFGLLRWMPLEFFCAIISALLIFYVSQIEEERFLALFVASLPLGIGTIFGGAWLYIRHRRMLLAMGRL
jgi:hypothetical protein